MNSKITKSTMLVALLGISSQMFAQDTPTNADRFGKQSQRTWSVGVHGGILSPNTIFGGSSTTARELKSIGYGGFVKKQILPSLGLQADFLRGDMKSFAAPGSNVEQKTNINYSGSLTAVFNITNFSLNNQNAVLIPYVKAGAGYMQSSYTVAGNDVYTKKEGWFIPTGIGLKFGVSKGINIDLGYDVNFVKSGPTVKAANSFPSNRFSYSHIGLEFAIGNKEKSQLQNYSAIADLRKQSAAESAELRAALSTAEQNAARDREQYAKDMGDDDGDGVANKFDKCAGTPAGTSVDGAGCPLGKPTVINKTTVITEADRKVVTDAIKNLEFDLGKATIRAKSYETLNKVAALLVEKNFGLKLAGHTDNTGSRAVNLRLSKERAESVKAYLVSQGANASLIEATGYGPDQPIASNKTATGRQKNRRVEFTLR